jgi:D-alanine--poly(phosphoribitol) ligase subunit 1
MIEISDRFNSCFQRFENRTLLALPERQYSYGEVYAYINELLAVFSRMEIGIGSPVALVAYPSAASFLARLAVLLCGATLIPIDANLPDNRIASQLQEVEASLVLIPPELSDRARCWIATRFVTIEFKNGCFSLSEMKRELGRWAENQPNHEKRYNGVGYILFTSGTTGTPKGVLLPYSAIAHFLDGLFDIFPERPPKFMHYSSIGFDIAIMETLYPVVSGSAVVPTDCVRKNRVDLLARIIEEFCVTDMLLVPSVARQVLKTVTPKQLESLERAYLMGEAVTSELVRSLRATSRARLFNMYGPTEATVVVTVCELTNFAGPQFEVPIGGAFGHATLTVRDTSGKLCEIGTMGEICISGPILASGYLKHESGTSERFRLDESGIGRYYRTGDLGCIKENGLAYCFGRLDTQVKLNGHRVDLQEIEQLAEVASKRSGILALFDSRVAETPKIILVCDAETSVGLDSVAVCKSLALQLPSEWCPSQIHVVDTIPLSVNGKVNKQELLESIGSSKFQAEILEPTTSEDLTEFVRQQWAYELGSRFFDQELSFFAMGGTSIGLVTILARTSEFFGRPKESELPLGQLNLGQFISLFEGHALAKGIEYSPHDFTQIPVSPIQQPRFQRSLSGVRGAHIVIGVVSVEVLDAARLLWAIRSVIQNEGAFRIQRIKYDSGWCHRVSDVPLVDVFHSGQFDDVDDLKASFETKAFETISELDGPIGLIEMFSNGSKHMLFLAIHHNYWDATSLAILLSKFKQVYISTIPPSQLQTAFLESCFAQAEWEAAFLSGGGILEFRADYPVLSAKLLNVQFASRATDLPITEGILTIDKVGSVYSDLGFSAASMAIAVVMYSLHTVLKKDTITAVLPTSLRESVEDFDTVGLYVNPNVLTTKFDAATLDPMKYLSHFRDRWNICYKYRKFARQREELIWMALNEGCKLDELGFDIYINVLPRKHDEAGSNDVEDEPRFDFWDRKLRMNRRPWYPINVEIFLDGDSIDFDLMSYHPDLSDSVMEAFKQQVMQTWRAVTPPA